MILESHVVAAVTIFVLGTIFGTFMSQGLRSKKYVNRHHSKKRKHIHTRHSDDEICWGPESEEERQVTEEPEQFGNKSILVKDYPSEERYRPVNTSDFHDKLSRESPTQFETGLLEMPSYVHKQRPLIGDRKCRCTYSHRLKNI